MRCQDVERLMLESNEKERAPEERRSLQAHLETCSQCAAFKDFRAGLRSVWENAPAPDLAPEFIEKVRRRCHDELVQGPSRPAAGVPWPIWAAFGVLTVITLGFFIPQILDFFSSREFTPALAWLLIILMQNAVMLFFAPVIMRHSRIGHDNWRECR